MSSCDLVKEQITVWTFTEDEIFHRWEIHQRYDLLNRYSAAFNKSSDKPVVKQDNSDAMMNFLESAIDEQGDEDD